MHRMTRYASVCIKNSLMQKTVQQLRGSNVLTAKGRMLTTPATNLHAHHQVNTSISTQKCLLDFNAKQEKYTSELSEKFQRVEGLELGDLVSCNMSTSIVCDGSQMSPTSVISVTTDLGLGMCSSPTSNKSKKPSSQYTLEPPKQISSLFSSKMNPKILFDALTKEVSWQDEASSVICKTIAGSHTNRVGANQRADVWMNFVGPDRNGKKKIAVSLAKFLYGSRDSFIFVDLSSEEMKGCNVKFRGKTTLDFIVGEYCKKPFSVVFLENVDKADVLVQNSLSQAIKTGKLTNSHGRAVGVKNAIFVTSFCGHQAREPSNYSEERILKVKGRPIKITVEHVSGDIRSQSVSVADGSIDNIPNPVLVNKRKFIGHNEFHDQHLTSDTAKRAHTTSNWHLDLNLPAEENELPQMNDGNSEHASTENQNLWLQDLYDQVDETIVFKPYNFDALADRVLKVITNSFHKTIGSECTLQIESEVMDQLLAAAYVSDGDKDIENWVEEVLSVGFTEVQRRYNLTACSIVKLATCSHQASSVYLLPSITMD
ncbi:Chaperone protein ClpB [Spatholobus suberectus]|nr:Chaperone protein ClpB [Spatholobus suberectus]